ncbi:CGNR zinc finger domain-containing protein [Mumia sp. zg.B17]|uniref:CGNR zinc finger domain-containing protein n=1 Tax=unclassified Mumia TaxID=2621872 RepID=UPI001C6E7875|nr:MULTISPECIES: CGNR zinc finger domain-containing protein [unclassified Mumia]MBW9207018.1 CGNR zinc finger domain-containing protein [Mumia sp. zg.B17]MBW9210646.1 CGNR zinc finger domain-containing protein [Mumia sp. zg.B21]MDD9348855.1 CGNR zinc finger domain-containing protein [Mumia sp.]
MDFVGYAERAAELVNARLVTVDDVRAHLRERQWLVRQATERDVRALRRFQRRLRTVFEQGSAGQPDAVVYSLNALLASHRITPLIVPTDATATDTATDTTKVADGAASGWRLHVADRAASVAELLVAESLMGLATLVCDLTPARLGVCAAHACTNTYVDLSPNRSRRFCSERCSSRANVAAYRARQKSRPIPGGIA